MTAGGQVSAVSLRTYAMYRDFAARPVGVVLSYEPGDPFAVRMLIVGDGEREVWHFDRALLVDGLRGPAGLHDVRVAPAGGEVAVTLTDTSHEEEPVTFLLPRGDVEDFARRTDGPARRAVARLDFDDELAALLDGAR